MGGGGGESTASSSPPSSLPSRASYSDDLTMELEVLGNRGDQSPFSAMDDEGDEGMYQYVSMKDKVRH